ncbi:MAG: RadC family protein [Cellulosilyticaceae bacterium]
MKMEEIPYYMRPYEKAVDLGVEALTDVELIAIMLRSGTKKYNVMALAQQLLSVQDQRPCLTKLYEHTVESLQALDGIGKIKAIQIVSLLEMCKRLSKYSLSDKARFTEPSAIARYFVPEFSMKKEEYFVAILLDVKCKLIHYEIISKGSLTASIVHPREVYRCAISKSAHSLIVLHNHPSGDPSPSKEDIAITKRLQEVGQMIGIPLIDHIILGHQKYTSLKEENYL